MADQIGGPLDVSHMLIQLQSLFSHKDSFHPGDNAVLRGDRPNHLVPTGTLSLPLRARSQELDSSLPLGKGLSQVSKTTSGSEQPSRGSGWLAKSLSSQENKAAAAKPHSPHKRSLGIILREEKARLMLSLPVCKSRSPPERPLGLIFWVKTTETRLMPSLGAQQMVSGFRLGEDHAKACVMLSLPVCKPRSPPERSLV